MSSSNVLYVIVGKNEPLYEYNKVQAADSVTRQNYFVLHSALDLVEKAAYTTTNMYLKVVDKVRGAAPHGLSLRVLVGRSVCCGMLRDCSKGEDLKDEKSHLPLSLCTM